MIVLFILTLVFSALWIKERYGEEDYHTTVERIDGMLSSIDYKVTQLSGRAEAGRPGQDDQELNGPVTRESVVTALRYHHFAVEDPDSDDHEYVLFTYRDFLCRIKTDKLPYISIEAGFRIEEEENVNYIMRIAREITYNMYNVKVMVSQEEKVYVYMVDFIADSYLQFRESLRKYLAVLLFARLEFSNKYDQIVEQRKQALNEALQKTLLAAQIDAAGNKILS